MISGRAASSGKNSNEAEAPRLSFLDEKRKEFSEMYLAFYRQQYDLVYLFWKNELQEAEVI